MINIPIRKLNNVANYFSIYIPLRSAAVFEVVVQMERDALQSLLSQKHGSSDS